MHFGRKLVLIGGTHYAGEIKKSIFTILNYMLPPAALLIFAVIGWRVYASMGVQNDSGASESGPAEPDNVNWMRLAAGAELDRAGLILRKKRAVSIPVIGMTRTVLTDPAACFSS